ncbi:MAG: hypothetical protein BVN35_00550 [Proteobacteria bacterium ST_bin11]|nr:MAG: hypothetical protein BVN35_00550 [Proteobacteria bacterium ST_bin11]
MKNYSLISLAGVLVLSAPIARATPADDAYIAGYAAAALKLNLNLDMPALTVKDGVLTLPAAGMSAAERAQASKVLAEIPGVSAVKIADTTVVQSRENAKLAADPSTLTTADTLLLPTGLLPTGHLFKSLLADPRWAHFSAAYRNYQSDNFDGRNIASVSFGETIPFYRANIGNSTAQWEAGLQAGVFSDFNLDASSSDLVNTDFIASIYSSVRTGQFSAFARLYHQSSHLGDEFLLRKVNTTFERVNLSYEGVDLKLSYELPYGVRVYGGGGGLFDKEPSALKTWSAQYGIEFRSPWRLQLASMRPIIAADVKNYDQNNWSADISARAGVEFDNSKVLGRKLQILVEYFNGYSPSGQFYKDKVEYVGLGAHYHF